MQLAPDLTDLQVAAGHLQCWHLLQDPSAVCEAFSVQRSAWIHLLSSSAVDSMSCRSRYSRRHAATSA